MKFPIGAKIAVATAAAVGVAAGGVGAVNAYAKDTVTLNLDGSSRTTETRAGTVQQLLDDNGVKVGEHDVVQPALTSKVSDGMKVAVQFGRPVTFVVDGKKVVKWTTAKSLDAALAQFSLDDPNALLSVNRSTPLGRQGLSVDITTAKDVTVKTAKGTKTVKTPGTVSDALKLAGVTVTSYDKVTPAVTTAVSEGLTVTYTNITKRDYVKSTPVKFTSTKTEDANLDEGTTKVKTKGVNGVQTQAWTQWFQDGKQIADQPSKVAPKVAKAPVNEVVSVGTKKKAAPKPDTSSKSSSGSGSNSGSGDNSSVSNNPNPSGESCSASFYDEGQMTASGEVFNPSAMTAAHKTLPLGTKIRVTNPSNGKSVVVRINDRGPYIAGRCLDLSAAAFGAIGNTGAGTMTVVWARV